MGLCMPCKLGPWTQLGPRDTANTGVKQWSWWFVCYWRCAGRSATPLQMPKASSWQGRTSAVECGYAGNALSFSWKVCTVWEQRRSKNKLNLSFKKSQPNISPGYQGEILLQEFTPVKASGKEQAVPWLAELQGRLALLTARLQHQCHPSPIICSQGQT